KQLRMIHKKELLWVPFFGFILWLLDFIAIDRGNRQRAAESLHRAAKKIHDGTNIVIYADGTRSIDGELRPFKKGAFILAIDAQVDVVPVTISGTINVIHKFEGVFDIRFGQTVELVFSPPISTDGMMPEAKDDLKDQVQNIIAAEYSKIKHLSAITNPAILSRLKK
ncbi:MAG TPA: lysophospholipid acyltransferase family protein, partial [bacterium]|nr:lysophospholipid acyltransferase family protein [bacterium]